MEMSSFLTTCLNLFQARFSLFRRVMGPSLERGALKGRLDRFALGQGREASILGIVGLTIGAAGSRTTTEVVNGVKESTFYFLLPRWLGRLTVSNFLDTVFLFSDETRGMIFSINETWGWVWARNSSPGWKTSSPTMPFLLFSFIVAIPIWEKESSESRWTN